jgi:hypothetical protein
MDLSAGPMIASLLVSLVGFAILWYGRKQQRVPHIVAGLLMMVFPYFISNALLIVGIGALLGGGLWLAVRFGA